MRILLINPAPGGLTIGLRRLAKMEPLALETLAAAVPDHEVRIVDLELERDLAGVLRSFQPELVGASAQIVQTYGARRALKLAKEHDPSTLTLVGVQFTFLIGGTVIVERLFSYEGLGNMAIDAVINRDLPLIQGIVLVFALLFVLINLAVDMTYALLNPRLRHG